jgi:predicted  nucleic acid-binding Zn-ribbon protein
MGPTLEALRELQDVELQIVDIRRQLAQKERLVKRQAAKLEGLREKLAAERESLRRAQMEVDEIDLDLKGRTGHVNRLREQLNSVRTNKEYAAVLAQLNNEKADATRLENRALQMMENVEARRKVVGQRETEEHGEAARLHDLTAQAEQVRRTFSEKLATLAQRRAAAIDKLPGEVVTLFERLSEHYEGEVMARIERSHPRRDEFTCGGCHMTLSADLANMLMVRDEVLTCKNCGRILHVDKRA